VKLLLTSDLHFHRPWYEWLLEHGPRYDLVAIAGDLMEMHYPGGVVPQLIYLHGWVQAMLKRGAVLAICSGNHDLPSSAPMIVPNLGIAKENLSFLEEFAKHEHWLQALRRNHQITVDQDHRIVRTNAGEMLMVSCAPYRADGQFLFREHFPPPWLLLHHEPPRGTKLATPNTGNEALAEFVRKTPPKYVLSGHAHYAAEGVNAFHERINEAHCFNCRQHPTTGIRPPVPNLIVLDTGFGTATWRFCNEDGTFHESTVELD
jgi:calcineurin-like phosphoesterase family protein